VKKNSKWLLFVFIALLVSAVAWKYSVYFLERDFLITDHVPCDPSTESCFVQDCDLMGAECDTEPYKRIEKSAAYISLCPNYLLDQCPALTCEVNEPDCTLTLCSEETLEEGEVCVHEPEASEPSTEEITE
jgi:hypothetical protein